MAPRRGKKATATAVTVQSELQATVNSEDKNDKPFDATEVKKVVEKKIDSPKVAKRGRPKKNLVEEAPQIFEELNTNSSETKSRSKKVAKKDETHENSENSENENLVANNIPEKNSKKRGRKDVKQSPPVKKTSARKKPVPEPIVPNPIAKNGAKSKVTVKSTKGNVPDVESEPNDGDLVVEPKKKSKLKVQDSHTGSNDVAEVEEPKKKSRSKKPIVNQPEDEDEVVETKKKSKVISETKKTEDVEAPKTKGRKRAPAKPVETIPVNKKTKKEKSEKIVKASTEKVVKALPEKVVKALPEEVVKASPEKVVKAPPEKVVKALPEKVVKTSPEKVEKASPEKVATTSRKRKVPEAKVVKPKENDANDELVTKRKKATKKPAPATPEAEPKKKKNDTVTDFAKINFETDKEFNMKICSWNVAGLRACVTKNGFDYFEYEKPDIICLQEIKCLEDQVPDGAKLRGYHPYWCSTPGGRGGVAILSKTMPYNVEYNIGDTKLDEEGRIITAEYSKFYLICVYVPNAGRLLVNMEQRMRWNKMFEEHVNKLKEKKPVVIMGDMNVAHSEIDLTNPKTNAKNAGFTKEERDGMTNLLDHGYIDTFRHFYPDQEKAYTFWSYMNNNRSKDIGWRLDYAIVSENFAPKVVDNIIRKEVLGSDHCPFALLLKL